MGAVAALTIEVLFERAARPRRDPPTPLDSMPATSDDVYDQLRQVFDPEIPVNIVDLGLIYDVKVEEPKVLITMTLTSQSCPEARTIPDVMKRRCNTIDGIEETEIDIVFEPAWTPQLISEDGRKALGMDED